MTDKEREEAIDALKMSAPVIPVTQEEFNDYLRILNNIMEWLKQDISLTNIDDLQRKIVKNKINKGFNTTDMNQEFVLLYGEVAEAYDAWKHKRNIGEELADVAIYILGIAELNNISLIEEIKRKIKVNEHREYVIDNNKNAIKI